MFRLPFEGLGQEKRLRDVSAIPDEHTNGTAFGDIQIKANEWL
jgi:hypothetical protein